jgi:hypothetical protein
MVLIYTPLITSRIQYVFDFILQEIGGMGFQLTTDLAFFESSSLPKFSYANEAIGSEFFIKAHPLLTDLTSTDYYKQTTFDSLEQAFPSNQVLFNNIDPFAATFYLLTRLEEFGNVELDELQRYLPKKSILYRNNQLQRPIIDEWAYVLRDFLLTLFPSIPFRNRTFKIEATIDVDRAFLFKARPFFNQLGAIAKSIVNKATPKLIDRLKVLLGFQKDPYDVFEELEKLHAANELTALYFFHCANYGGLDKNIQLQHPDFTACVQQLQKTASIGLHCSVKSYTEPTIRQQEVQFLNHLLKQTTTQNRSHYILLNTSNYPLELLKLGITSDYSMGYPQLNGFRAGTCTPFPHFNLSNEKTEHFYWHPFAIIESAYQDYQSEQEREQWKNWESIINAVKKVDGTLSLIYHNHSYSNYGIYTSGAEQYKKLLNLARQIKYNNQ